MQLLQVTKKWLTSFRNSLADSPTHSASLNKGAILDQYVTTAPSFETSVNIFAGEWSSAFPSPYESVTKGTIGLFEDVRIQWLLEQIGSIEGQTVLELGPLEGGHTYMMEQAGAAQVVAIEANTRAYLKCLITKELLKLHRAQFLCGDFVEYLSQNGSKFDICLASGVLYHMVNPVELIALLAQHCQRHLFLWTHYYDSTILESPIHAPRFRDKFEREFMGFSHTLHRREYETALNWSGFCGGSATYSHWMLRDDILKALEYFGFSNIRINFDAPDHPHGPAFALIADR